MKRGVPWSYSARCPTSPELALYKTQLTERRGQRLTGVPRTAPGSPSQVSEPQPGERSPDPEGNASCSTAPSPDKAGELLGSRALLCIPREIGGKASRRPCPEWSRPHPFGASNPLGSCLSPLHWKNELQPKPLLTSVPFPSWHLPACIGDDFLVEASRLPTP